MKVAIITGAAQGIGRHTAQLFAAAGYSLALIDRQPCPAISGAIEAQQYTGDITDESFVASTIGAIHQHFGAIDVLVNNAGISFISPAEKVSGEDFRRVLRSEEHTSELQSQSNLVCRLLLE